MLIAMVSGILVGLLFMAGREYFSADSAVWNAVISLLFQDINIPGLNVLSVFSISWDSFSSGLCSSSLFPWFSALL